MIKIGVLGFGFVGKAVYEGFKDSFDVLVYDRYNKKDNYLEVVKCDVIFMCLPTPYDDKNNNIDLKILGSEIAILNINCKKDTLVVIKSTVTPGTTEKYIERYPDLRFVMNPEFLTEKNSHNDFKSPDRIILGTNCDKDYKAVRDIYDRAIPISNIIKVTPTEAEIIKYQSNVMLASQVAIANIFFDICKEHGADYNEVMDGVSFDKRIGSHMKVTEDRGFGGKCFYKDLGSIIGVCKDKKIDGKVLEEIHEYNLRIRKNRDWEEIPGASTHHKNHGDK